MKRRPVAIAWIIAAAAAVAAGASPADVAKSPVPGPDKEASDRPVLARALQLAVTSDDPHTTLAKTGFRTRDGAVQVVVVADEPASAPVLERWLRARGALHVSSAGSLVQADVPLDLLPEIAGRDDVVYIRRPTYVVPPEKPTAWRGKLASSVSEGVAAMGADQWHAAGHSGAGVKVGVIDSGFGGYQSLLGSDLPTGSMVHYQDFSGWGLDPEEVHGTACAEIVYDVAPGVELYLAQVNTTVDIANATSWIRSQGGDVISMSLGWLSWGPGDGTGVASDAINSFVGAGGVWVNSAGNSRLAHWQGSWYDPNGNGYLDFDTTGWEINYVTDGSDRFWLSEDTDVYASLVWNQWNAPTTDLDFFLYRWNGTDDPVAVASSDNYQNGQPGQLPVEDFSFTTTEDGYYGFAIQRYAGTGAVDIEMFNRFDLNPLQFNVQDGSLTPPAGTANAIAAAAIDAVTFSLEPYSSRGPTNGAGGALSGGRVKPDVAAFAGVTNQSYGPRNQGGFSGTSAACPHIAGAAALVWGAYPAYSGSQVRSYLEGGAVDMGSSGKDIDFGHGRLLLGAPPSGGCSAPGVPGNLRSSASTVPSGTSYTISWNAAANADGYTLQEATNPSFSGATNLNATGTSRTITHAVAADTTYYYRVRATRSCGSTSGWSGTIQVRVTSGGGGGAFVYWLPGAAHVAGAQGSQWRCDLGVLNLGTGMASLTFTLYIGNQTLVGTGEMPAGQQGVYLDIVGQFGATGSGHLKVESDQQLIVTARIFNQSAEGTFGQYMQGFAPSDGLAAGEEAILPQLAQHADARTNVGVANMGTSSATVQVTLYTGNGAVAGSFNMTVPSGQVSQDNEPYRRRFNVTNMLGGYATVRVLSGSGITAYASVVDNDTNDATTFLMWR